MKIVIAVLVIIVQFVVGQTLGFGAAIALGVGNGIEIIVFAVGSTLGVWGTGWIATRLLGSRYAFSASNTRLIGTVIGAAAGAALILITPPIGFIPALFPLIGALIGYHFAPAIGRRLRRRAH